MTVKRTLGRQIRRLRRERGWDYATLAFSAGISEKTLRRMERGESMCAASLDAVLYELGCTVKIEVIE